MQKWIIAALVLLVVAVTGFAFSGYAPAPAGEDPNATSTGPWMCNGDAKICPDGSSVGRTGPNCEFAACPSPDATSAILTTFLGGSTTGLNVTVNPHEVVSDSRCAQGVQCVWAGTVEVRTAVSTQVAHGEHVLKLGESRIFGEFSVTLVAVTPAAQEGVEIPNSSYRFTFEVKKQ